MPASTATANGVSTSAIGVEPAACASGRRCRGRAGTRRSCSRRTRRSPRTRTRAPGRRAAARGSSAAAATTSTRKRLTRNAEVVEGEGVGRRGDQLDARRDLRREGADEDEQQQPERERCHVTTINAETAEHAENEPGSADSASSALTVVYVFSAVDDRRHDLEQIADDAVVGDLEDRRVGDPC